MHFRKELISAVHSSRAPASLLLKQAGHLWGGAGIGKPGGSGVRLLHITACGARAAGRATRARVRKIQKRVACFGSFMMESAITVGSSRRRTPVSVLTLRPAPAAARVLIDTERQPGGVGAVQRCTAGGRCSSRLPAALGCPTPCL